MSYGVVWPSFWTGPTGRSLRGDPITQLVAVYLMTCSHKNSLGVYRCPPTYIETDTGIPSQGASKALLSLSEASFCFVDEGTDTVWVYEMAFYQIGAELKAGDNRLKSVHRLFTEIENEQIQRAFFEKYKAAYQLPEPTIRSKKVSLLQAHPTPLASPSEANNYNYVNNNTDSVPTERTPVVASPADLEKELFDRGKQVLGKSAGGQIAKLKKAKGGNTALARAAIEQASTKQNPGEYIAAVIKGGAGLPQFAERVTNGFADRLVRNLQEQHHAADREPIDVTPNQPAGSGGAEGIKELAGR
jgi:hypothetical protein